MTAPGDTLTTTDVGLTRNLKATIGLGKRFSHLSPPPELVQRPLPTVGTCLAVNRLPIYRACTCCPHRSTKESAPWTVTR
jgi:hypothetical protein